MTDSLLQRVSAIVAATFNVSEADIAPGTSPATLEAWDSMGHLMLVLALEQDFGIQIPPESVERMTDVGSIVAMLAELAESAR